MEKIVKLIRQHEHFLVTTHALPDGDGLGSEMALHSYLKKSGKKSVVFNPSPTPAKFQLVDPAHSIHVYKPGDQLPRTDVVFIMDTNELKMLGPMQRAISELGAQIVYVDHHVPEIENITEHLIDESYSSTGELVYTFLRHLKADIDAEMALSIYVALFTDTGGFRYKRTTARTHEVASELLKKGVLPERVFQQIYAHDSIAKMRLFGCVLENVQTSDDAKIAWLTVSKKKRDLYHATIEDTESYVNALTLVEGVNIGILFREEDDGRIKFSLRGIGETPVIGIAKKFGGGGHRHAAGGRVTGSLEDVSNKILKEAKDYLNDHLR